MTLRAVPADENDHGDRVASPDRWADALPAPGQPMKVARRLLRDIAPDGTLRSWRDQMMRHHGTHWAEEDRASVRADLYRRTENADYVKTIKTKAGGEEQELQPFAPNRHKISDLVEALDAVTHLPAGVEPPAWIGGQHDRDAAEYVSASNGLLHVGSRTLTPHTPDFFNEVHVPFDYAADADCPAWHEFLAELWPGDPASATLLQQWFGYVLSGRTDLQKIMLLVGPKRSGKGTIARILSALVGGNVAGPTLATLAMNFGLSPLLGKPLAVVGDARPQGSMGPVVERLLQISGEDLITVDRKFRNPWTGRCTARLMVLSNELPELGDSSAAIASRFLILKLARSWIGHEDTRLENKLRSELPGILNWALSGMQTVGEQHRFDEPASSESTRTQLEYLTSPIMEFITDICAIGPDQTADKALLYNKYRVWCDHNGQRPVASSVFARDLMAAETGIRAERPTINGKRVQHFTGVGVRPAMHSTPDTPDGEG